MTAAATQQVLATIDRDFDASMARLFDFCAFPASAPTLPTTPIASRRRNG